MKRLMSAALLVALLASCSPAREVVQIVKGDKGDSGNDGYSFASVSTSAGCECDEAGGTRLDIYLDLDRSESVTEGDAYNSSIVVCNGNNGAQGQQGVAGEQGPQGIQGIPGPQGEAGAEGQQGIAGPTGPMGPQGPQGLQGPQGGAGALIQNYTLNSSCQSVGDGFYAKKDGSVVKLFRDLPGNSGADCDSSGSDSNFFDYLYADHTSNGTASVWLSSTRLGFNDGNGNLRVVKFN